MGSKTKTTEAPALRRELKARHLTMIAIGGSIGTGLFVASGATISQAGPGGALFSYILIGLMVYFLMTSLGELAAYMPVSGSFATYGQNYVEEGFGFALGWNYWYNWAVTIAVDLVAAQLVMGWWFPDTPGWIWSALFLCVIFLLNYISVRGFGEAEYWFSLIKVATVIIFIIVGVAMIIGIFKGVEPVGWSNWTTGDAPFAGGFAAMIGVAMIVGFSFQGTELIGIAAGESEPYRSGFFPLGPIFAFVLCLIITLGQNYEAFLKDTIDWGGVAATYIGIPLFLLIWFGYKLIKGTHFVRYSEMHFPERVKK
ncbi:Lysine-specific permease [Salmonella enterica subsp. enterica serovar Uganda str. R8-3404]|uniref:Lysine-specific permease n=1 Tax=Salmonella enterica subsp. enterica serovar Uganda str. R8-3404 TaxID=913083 RepID=A0A6C8H196_SALET|nr:Lysine-specific permease [Salmonella enterica subsp. enterica serovar Uganda str. R8-3404]